MNEGLRDSFMAVLCTLIIFFAYTFVLQAHFTPINQGVSVGCATDDCPAAEIAQWRQKVTYPASSDWYPMSYGFKPPVRQWREWIRQYRQSNLRREHGNYGYWDELSTPGNLVDPVGLQSNAIINGAPQYI